MKPTNNQVALPKILLIGLLLAAVITGVQLVTENQNINKSAYFSQTTLFTQPAGDTFSVGDKVPVQIWVNAAAKTNFVQTKLCYDSNKVRLFGETPAASVSVKPPFTNVLFATNTTNCISFAVKAEVASDQQQSGSYAIATVDFAALSEGSAAFDLSIEDSTVSGFNPDLSSTDPALYVTAVQGSTVTITNTGNNPTPTDVPVPTSTTAPTPTDVPVPTSTPIVLPTNTVRPTNSPTQIPTQPVVPTATTTPVSGSARVNFKVTFSNVKPTAQCANGLWVTVLATRNDGYSVGSNTVQIPVTKVADSTLAIYQATVDLPGFKAGDMFSLFVRGPRHLQTKYGINGQVGYYNQQQGQLVIGDLANTTLDFTGYPLLAGDVLSAQDVNGDGIINGLDYSFVKNEVLKGTDVGSATADLDYNCALGASDLNLVKISLNERQSQRY